MLTPRRILALAIPMMAIAALANTSTPSTGPTDWHVRYLAIQTDRAELDALQLKVLALRTQLQATQPDLDNATKVMHINATIIDKLAAELDTLTETHTTDRIIRD